MMATRRSPTAQMLWALGRKVMALAQGNLCPVCGGRLSVREDFGAVTVDHVWPRSLATAMRPSPARSLEQGNTLLVHQSCNTAKGNRPPRGCELLFLFAVNRRLGLPEGITACWDRPQ